MKIVIDLQACQSACKHHGIGRYSLALAQAMAQQAKNNEIWLALNGAFPETIYTLRNLFADTIPRQRIVVFGSMKEGVAEVDSNNLWRARASELTREAFLQSLNPDIVHVASLFEGWQDNAVTSISAYTPIPTAVTLYDLIPFMRPDAYLSFKPFEQHYLRKIAALKKSDILLAISEHSRQEAAKELPYPSEKIFNISAAVDDCFKQRIYPVSERARILKECGITKPFILYVSSGFDPRKNINRLFEAFSLLPNTLRDNYQLVLPGKISEDQKSLLIGQLKKFPLKADAILFPGYVNDDDLIALYNFTHLFVFPSLHEGFGLPVLEALSCGAPTIGANATSVPEIIAWTDALFDPYHVHSIAALIEKALTDEAYRQKLIRNAGIQAKKFSWQKSAQLALLAFEEYHQENKTQNSQHSKTVNEQYLIQKIAQLPRSAPVSDHELRSLAEVLAQNISQERLSAIYVDITVLAERDARTGIQRVVRSILLSLLTTPPDNYQVQPVYFDGTCYRYANQYLNKKNIVVNQLLDEPIAAQRGDIYLGLDYVPHLIKSYQPILENLNRLGVTVSFVVYDILTLRHPEWWPEGAKLQAEKWLIGIIECAHHLLCISQATTDDVNAWMQDYPEPLGGYPRLDFFHIGADISNSAPTLGCPDNADNVLAQLKQRPSFLIVGTLEPRKGHAQALAAFELLWEKSVEINLVIVGKQGWMVDDLVEKLQQHPELNQRLFWLNGISDEYLGKIYDDCTCLIAPSEGEGFGLPLIEAAQHNLPIIARDIPVFREVSGDHAYYFSGMDALFLEAALQEWLTNYEQDNYISSANLSWLTWQESARQLMNKLLSTC